MQNIFRATCRGACALSFGLLAAACAEREVEPVTLFISGDSIIAMTTVEFENDAAAADCAVRFIGAAEGPEGEHAVVRGGRVDYFWWESGQSAGTYEWSGETATRLWGDSVIVTGQRRMTDPHGFGQPVPPRLLRAEVTFEYATSNESGTRQTEPFRFYCY
jgi:hypothetical protein